MPLLTGRGITYASPASWAARTAAVMDACCPAAPGGHRHAQDRTCPLPDTCPSAACAVAFVAYYNDCALELQGHVVELPLPQYRSYSECSRRSSRHRPELPCPSGRVEACSVFRPKSKESPNNLELFQFLTELQAI